MLLPMRYTGHSSLLGEQVTCGSLCCQAHAGRQPYDC